MIQDKMQIRARYAETDRMGYVYHANYLVFCHQARNELLRKFEIRKSNLIFISYEQSRFIKT